MKSRIEDYAMLLHDRTDIFSRLNVRLNSGRYFKTSYDQTIVHFLIECGIFYGSPAFKAKIRNPKNCSLLDSEWIWKKKQILHHLSRPNGTRDAILGGQGDCPQCGQDGTFTPS